jgi:Glutathione S-transferase, N-terminal domain
MVPAVAVSVDLKTTNVMTEPMLKLVTFALSHFCEKARWALDWHGIAYDEISGEEVTGGLVIAFQRRQPTGKT